MDGAKRESDLTSDEEHLLQRLAQRQQESETAEASVLRKYGSRAALAKQVWLVLFGCGTAVVLGTVYVLGLQTTIELNSSEISSLRGEVSMLSGDVSRNKELITDLRLEMKDKANRREQP